MEFKQLTACPFCGLKDDYSRLALKCDPEKQSITYAICQCGYIYADYYMADMEDYYKEQYHNDVNVKYGTEGISQEVISNEMKRAAIIMPVIEQFGNITSALDFGSSSGYLLSEIKNKFNCDIWGVEISQVFRDYANLSGIPSVEDIDMIGGTFSLITCIHVLEHALDPSKILNGLYAHGDSNTTYIFQVPFFSYGFFHPVLYSYNMFATVLDAYGFVTIKQLLNPANLTFVARKK